MVTSTKTQLLELVPRRLYAVSSRVPLDGRVSWAPALPGRTQRVNCYLLVEDGHALLVDTGLAIHAAETAAALQEVLGPDGRLSIVLTRAEMDCVSGIGAISRVLPVERLMAGGAANPFDAFDGAGELLGRRELIGLEQPDSEGLVLARAKEVDVGPGRSVKLITPALRLLATFWVHDPATATLFTSDLFGHTDTDEASASPVIDDRSPDSTSIDSVRRHLLAKHWWLRKARRDRLADELEQLVTTLQPAIVAPTHGCILVGEETVRRHLDMLLAVLRSDLSEAA